MNIKYNIKHIYKNDIKNKDVKEIINKKIYNILIYTENQDIKE
ncbi:MAG: hypothetical protein RSG51_03350 [Bacilli bacterium]